MNRETRRNRANNAQVLVVIPPVKFNLRAVTFRVTLFEADFLVVLFLAGMLIN